MAPTICKDVKKASKHVKSDVANVGFPALRVDIDNPLATGGSEQDRKSNLEKEMIKTFLFFVFCFHKGILLSSMHATS